MKPAIHRDGALHHEPIMIAVGLPAAFSHGCQPACQSATNGTSVLSLLSAQLSHWQLLQAAAMWHCSLSASLSYGGSQLSVTVQAQAAVSTGHTAVSVGAPGPVHDHGTADVAVK